TCSDGIKNGAETDVDCGDPAMACPRCAAGKTCSAGSSCAGGRCSFWNSTGVLRMECRAGSCTDGVKNGDELDVDCGDLAMVCPRCATGKNCYVNLSCTSGICALVATTPQFQYACQAPTCGDAVRNGGESAVDCGGATSCPRCASGLACTQGSDCTSGSCV